MFFMQFFVITIVFFPIKLILFLFLETEKKMFVYSLPDISGATRMANKIGALQASNLELDAS